VLEDVIDLLRCPYCAARLARAGRSLRCPAKHTFDVGAPRLREPPAETLGPFLEPVSERSVERLQSLTHADARALVAMGPSARHADAVLWLVDGHADFYDGETSPTGEAADMELAILTGRTDVGGFAALAGVPLLMEPAHTVVLGHRPPSLHPDVALELARVPGAIGLVDADADPDGRYAGETVRRLSPALSSGT